MGRASRILLWVLAWPAGLIASLRHGTKKRHKQMLAEVRSLKADSGPSNPQAVGEIAARLSAMGYARSEQLRMTSAAMKLVHDGTTVDDAVRQVVRDHTLEQEAS